MAKNPTQIAAKWASNLAASTEQIRSGVEGVTEAPTAKAARAKDRWLAGVQAAHADGSFERGLQSVSLSDWQQSFINKGLQRIASGATAARSKFEDFMSRFMQHVDRGVASLPPRGSIEENIQRAVQMMHHNAQFKNRS